MQISIPSATRMKQVAEEERRKSLKQRRQDFREEYSDELEDYLSIVVAKILKRSKSGQTTYREDQIEKHSGISRRHTNLIREYLVEKLEPYGYSVNKDGAFVIMITW